MKKAATARRHPSKPCRIWVVGPHRAGKSHLARWIAKRYKLPLFDEVARIEVAKMGAKTFDQLRVDLDAVTAFQRNVFETQLSVGAGVSRFVSDRAFDNLAYAAENADVDLVADLWESPKCRKYVADIAAAVNAGEGVVFFVRPGVGIVDDGTCATSDLSSADIYRIDGMVKLLLGLGRVRYVPIETTVFQERASAVDAVLKFIV